MFKFITSITDQMQIQANVFMGAQISCLFPISPQLPVVPINDRNSYNMNSNNDILGMGLPCCNNAITLQTKDYHVAVRHPSPSFS